VLFSGLLMAALIRFLYLLIVEPDGAARFAQWWRWARSRVAGRLTLALILIAIAIVLSVRMIDRPVAEWAHALSPGIRAVMQWITQLGVSTGWLILSGVPVILFVLSRRWLAPSLRARWQSYAYLPLFAFVSIAGAGIANSLVKAAAGRFRPKLYFLDQRFGFDLWHRTADYTSFPSGHTVTVFALASALALIWRPLAWPGFALALLVGLSRIMVARIGRATCWRRPGSASPGPCGCGIFSSSTGSAWRRRAAARRRGSARCSACPGCDRGEKQRPRLVPPGLASYFLLAGRIPVTG